jgi:hypothetical protein
MPLGAPQAQYKILLSMLNLSKLFLLDTNFTPIQNRKMQPASSLLSTLFNYAHKVLIYIEHHSVCPLVGIGTPPPL